MATVQRWSTALLGLDQIPPIIPGSWLASLGVINSSLTDNLGSVYRFGVVPSSVRLQDVQLQCDAAIGGVWQLGLFNNDKLACTTVIGGVTTTTPPGAVPVTNANLIFGTGIATPALQPSWRSIYSPTTLGGSYNAFNVNSRVWELLGLDIDPFYEFHLTLTLTAALTATGNIALQWSTIR